RHPSDHRTHSIGRAVGASRSGTTHFVNHNPYLICYRSNLGRETYHGRANCLFFNGNVCTARSHNDVVVYRYTHSSALLGGNESACSVDFLFGIPHSPKTSRILGYQSLLLDGRASLLPDYTQLADSKFRAGSWTTVRQ